jgi:quercetin dioxygenase-like cupin family protein
MSMREHLEHLLAQPQVDTGTVHHFAGGVYCKQMHLPAGCGAITHAHRYDHLSVLAAGEVDVWTTENGTRRYVAPAVITIAAGVQHGIHAHRDAVWLCIHATDETDPERVDDVLITKGE